jgi:hypothetical protein
MPLFFATTFKIEAIAIVPNANSSIAQKRRKRNSKIPAIYHHMSEIR